MRRLVTITLCTLVVTACGSDSATAPQSPPAASQGGGAAAPAQRAVNRCPLTAEQVSAAVGGAVDGPDSSCSFFAEDKALPNAAFVAQAREACSEEMRREFDYADGVADLGHPAYVKDGGDGSWVLVCTGNAPFEIRVDVANDERARAAAVALARVVLAAR
ncbi:MAG: hypothetical protein AB7U83_09115 [Vicinamibacterales bacterium]